MIGKLPVPPFPHWTGVKATLGREYVEGGQLHVDISVRLTRRARLWLRWRLLTRKGVPGAAA